MLHSTEPHTPLGFLAGLAAGLYPQLRDWGTHGTGHPMAALLSPRSRSQRKPSGCRRWPRAGMGGRAHAVPWEHRDRRGALTALGLAAKPHIAWSVC